jgi:hypothetical protein
LPGWSSPTAEKFVRPSYFKWFSAEPSDQGADKLFHGGTGRAARHPAVIPQRVPRRGEVARPLLRGRRMTKETNGKLPPGCVASCCEVWRALFRPGHILERSNRGMLPRLGQPGQLLTPRRVTRHPPLNRPACRLPRFANVVSQACVHTTRPEFAVGRNLTLAIDG